MSDESDYAITFQTHNGSCVTVFTPSPKLHRKITNYALAEGVEYQDIIVKALHHYFGLVDNTIKSTLIDGRITALKAELEKMEAIKAEAMLHENQ